MMRLVRLALVTLLALAPVPAFAQKLDTTPRTVVMTAFPPEWDALVHSVSDQHRYTINGLPFMTGVLEGKPVVLMQSGVSMVNAAMNTQLVLDRFTVKRIVFSGIAGGVDPSLTIGDVVVPADWGQYLEADFARRTTDGWKTPERLAPGAPANFGMIFPRGTRVGSADAPWVRHYRLPVDPGLLRLAARIAAHVTLQRCARADPKVDTKPVCLAKQPKIVVGGTGVSAGIYADNARFRRYLFKAWHADVLDMESAAVVQVAYVNQVPVIVFRSLSDLAGGDAGANQMDTFMTLASGNSADVVRKFVAALPD